MPARRKQHDQTLGPDFGLTARSRVAPLICGQTSGEARPQRRASNPADTTVSPATARFTGCGQTLNA